MRFLTQGSPVMMFGLRFTFLAEAESQMTWKRVATAVVLIPLVVSLVLAGSTGLVAVAVALVILLAIFEYFSLGEAIGHRAYRLCTAFCAMMLVYVQYLAALDAQHSLNDGTMVQRVFGLFEI